jgi:hypothetical protein
LAQWWDIAMGHRDPPGWLLAFFFLFLPEAAEDFLEDVFLLHRAFGIGGGFDRGGGCTAAAR